MAFINGDPFVSGSLLSFQQALRMMVNFRGATVPSNLQAGALWSDSDDNRLWHQGATLDEVFTEKTTLTWENLLSNSGFGVWSQSDAAKGLATLTYDTGAKGGGSAPSVGDSLAGGTSGATAKLISYTTTDSWDAGTAYGVLTLGAVTGTFIDNETITFETNQETCLVNGDESIGITNDPCNNDDKADWTQDGDSLGFDTDHYEWATSAVNKYCYKGSLAFTKGKIYKIEIDLKDGAATPTDIKIYFYDGAEQIDKAINTTGSFVKYTATFECATTVTNTGRAGIKAPTSLGGDDIEIRRFSVYEITPCCTVADFLALDGWAKDTTADIYRQHNDGGTLTKDGSFYSLKLVPSAAADFVYFPNALWDNEEYYLPCAGRTITFGIFLKTSTASHARISIQENGGENYSSYHTGGGGWEWIELTLTIGAAPTSLAFLVYASAAPNVDGSTIVYVSQPMLVFGSHIGEGNYQPKQGEIVWLEKYISSNLLNGLTDQSDVSTTTINLEADVDGKLPKGAKAIWIYTGINDSGSAGTDCFLYLRANATQELQCLISAYGLANDTGARQFGWQGCSPDGDFDYVIEASGENTFDLSAFRYLGVQVN